MRRTRLGKAWSRLWAGAPGASALNAQCPVCQGPVAVGSNTYLGNAYSGPMMMPWTPEELTAACAVHGRPPANEATVKALEKRAAEGGA